MVPKENTLVNQVGRALLCDFGLARTLDDGPSGLTTTSQPFTARYASPEVLLDASIWTLSSDVWSWGCLVYQVSLRGKRASTRRLIYSRIAHLRSDSISRSGFSRRCLHRGHHSPTASRLQCTFTVRHHTCRESVLDIFTRVTAQHETMRTSRLRDRPGYRVSAYFRGLDSINPLELPEAFTHRVEGIKAVYNPDVNSTVNIKSMHELTLKWLV